MESSYDYLAFISYSHRNMGEARILQAKLERYRLPSALRRECPDTPDSIRVFRDQTDLVGIELQSALQNELRASRFLIVICSPASAHSSWVNDEIRFFKSLGRTEQIIPFIVDGEPESSDPRLECYPDDLRNIPNYHALGANVRELGWRVAFYKLVSLLLGVRFNRIVDREKRRRRLRILCLSALSSLLLVTIGSLALKNYRASIQNELLSYQMFSDGLIRMAGVLEAPDYEGARNSFRLAAEAGNTDAIAYLCDLYENGLVECAEEDELFYLYLKGAEAGNMECMYNLATCYLFGMGTTQDTPSAISWLIQASESGNSTAMQTLSLCYEEGVGLEKNPSLAANWLRKAAEAGNQNALAARDLRIHTWKENLKWKPCWSSASLPFVFSPRS